MSGIKILSAKCIEGNFLYQKLFLVFMLCFSMNSYSVLFLKIDHDNSKEKATVHVMEGDKILNTETIAGKEVFILRYFKLHGNKIKIIHSILVKHANDTMSRVVLDYNNGGWLFSNKLVANETVSILKMTHEEFIRRYKRLEKYFSDKELSPFKKESYIDYLRMNVNIISTKKDFWSYEAVLDIWKADGGVHESSEGLNACSSRNDWW